MGTVCFPAVANVQNGNSRSTVTYKAPTPRVLIIQNDVLCPPCSAIVSLIEHGITYQVIYGFHEFAFRNIHPLMYEAIICLGGRTAVHEAHKVKWMENELKFITTALREKVPILGICLGCQILAKCAGGQVFTGDKGTEIGYRDWGFHNDETEEKGNDNLDELDPFLHALKYKDMDKYVVLFHSDTFSLPQICALNGQKTKILAKTNKYTMLYKIGKYNYGFQGHPELNHDLVKIWCRGWDQSFLDKADVDIERDVIEYSKKNKDLIDKSSKILFDIWIDIALMKDVPELKRSDTNMFDEYASTHWNTVDDKNEFPIAFSSLF